MNPAVPVHGNRGHGSYRIYAFSRLSLTCYKNTIANAEKKCNLSVKYFSFHGKKYRENDENVRKK